MTPGKVEFLHGTKALRKAKTPATGYRWGDVHTHVTNDTFPSTYAKDPTNRSARAGLSGAEQRTGVGY